MELTAKSKIAADSEAMRRHRMVSAVAIIGSVSLLTAAAILFSLGLRRYFPAAACILVGLHLVPLNWVLRQSWLRVLGWGMVVGGAGLLFVLMR